MRISFDIDDTLICYLPGSKYEPNRVPRLLRPWFDEPLRLGAVDLMRELRRLGCEIGVYTTSYRPPGHLRTWFRFYGVQIDFVINQDRHDREVDPRQFARRPSKYPRGFGIDLHVDDSDGVRMEGDLHGFRVVVIDPMDDGWTTAVITAVKHRLWVD
jgi:hypothetical protein